MSKFAGVIVPLLFLIGIVCIGVGFVLTPQSRLPGELVFEAGLMSLLVGLIGLSLRAQACDKIWPLRLCLLGGVIAGSGLISAFTGGEFPYTAHLILGGMETLLGGIVLEVTF